MTNGREIETTNPNDATYEAAMRTLIAERWAAVWRAVPVALAGEETKGVKDVRVASRRLRAAMDVAAGCFPPQWYAPLHQAAKEITGALGEVRDRDVMIEYLDHERKGAPPAEQAGLDLLLGRIETERVAARSEMESFLSRLLAGGVPADTARHFGDAALPAGFATDGLASRQTEISHE